METIKIGELVCEVVRSSRRTVGMRVSEDGAVQILSPRRLSPAKLAAICAPYEKKLLQMREKKRALNEQRQSFSLSYGSLVRFLGKRREIRSCAAEGALYDSDALYIKAANTAIKAAVICAYKRAAEEYIPQRVADIAPKMGLSPLRVRINSAKTHFASCSKKSSLNFSWYCMMASPEALDYIIVHELCHIRHFNHSAKFWAEVEKYCPDYKKYKLELKSLSRELSAEDWS